MDDDQQRSRREHLKKEISALFWAAIGAYLCICLLSFNNGDPSFNNNLHPEIIRNLGGPIGAHLADLLYQLFGLASLLLPPACFFFAWRLFRFRDLHPRWYKIGAFLSMIFALDGLISLKVAEVSVMGQAISEAGGRDRPSAGGYFGWGAQYRWCCAGSDGVFSCFHHVVDPLFSGVVS